MKNVPITTDTTEILEHLVELYFKHDYEAIYKILKIEHNPNYIKNKKPTDKYYKKNIMLFSEDNNPLTQVRIHVDEETRNWINIILMISSSTSNEKDVISLIVNKWINKIGVLGILKNITVPEIDNTVYIHLEIRKDTWNDLSSLCKNKGITMKEGFKMSIVDYLNEISLNI